MAPKKGEQRFNILNLSAKQLLKTLLKPTIIKLAYENKLLYSAEYSNRIRRDKAKRYT